MFIPGCLEVRVLDGQESWGDLRTFHLAVAELRPTSVRSTCGGIWILLDSSANRRRIVAVGVLAVSRARAREVGDNP